MWLNDEPCFCAAATLLMLCELVTAVCMTRKSRCQLYMRLSRTVADLEIVKARGECWYIGSLSFLISSNDLAELHVTNHPNASAPSSFIANAHNALYAFYTEYYRKKCSAPPPPEIRHVSRSPLIVMWRAFIVTVLVAELLCKMNFNLSYKCISCYCHRFANWRCSLDH